MKLYDGKYEIKEMLDGSLLVYRHGELWRDITGDGFILSLIQKAEVLDEIENTIDIDKDSWEQIKVTAACSDWIPKEYSINDWVSDICSFLMDKNV